MIDDSRPDSAKRSISWKELRETIVRSFGSFDELDMIIREDLGKDLCSLVQSDSLNLVLFRLLRVAQSEGWLESLLKALSDRRPENEQFRASMATAIRFIDDSTPGQLVDELAKEHVPSRDFHDCVKDNRKAARSNARTPVLFSFDKHLLPIGGIEELGLAFEEVLLACRSHDDLPPRVTLPNHDNLKAELANISSASGLEARNRRIEILKQLRAGLRYDADHEEVLQEFIWGVIRACGFLNLHGGTNHAISLVKTLMYQPEGCSAGERLFFASLKRSNCSFSFCAPEPKLMKEFGRHKPFTFFEFITDQELISFIVPPLVHKFVELRFTSMSNANDFPKNFFSYDWICVLRG